MNANKNLLIKNYLSNINVNVSHVGFTNVGSNWNDIDYVPDYNKFYFICKGEGWVKIGEEEFYPKPGQLIMMPQGIKQSYSSISQQTYTKYWCHFTAKIGDMNIFDIINLPYCINVNDDKELICIFSEVLSSFESSELSSSLILKSSILRLIAYYLDHNTISKINIISSETTEKLNFLLCYIDENFSKNITIEELAKMIHLHPNYFIRFFKKHMGTSPKHYINKRRIEEAQRLLTTTDLTLSNISSKVGTTDIYYLSKLFKDYTGYSPTMYRSMYLNLYSKNENQ